MKLLIIPILLLFITIGSAESITIFGEINENLGTGTITFDMSSATHPSMLYYDFEEGYGKETLWFEVTDDLEIKEGKFEYTTEIYQKDGHDYVAWLGSPYYVIESSNDWYLSQLLIDEDEDDEHSIKPGDTLNLGEGYTLVPLEISTEGNEVWFELSRDGEVIYNSIITENNEFKYKEDLNDNGNKDNWVVKFNVSTIFNGIETNIVEIIELQVVSTNVLRLDLPDDDLLSDYKITSPASDVILIELENDIDLKKDGTVDLLGGQFQFKVNEDGDIGGVVKILEFIDSDCPECPEVETIYSDDCPECPECPEAEIIYSEDCPPCPDCPECPECPEVTVSTPTPEVSSEIPSAEATNGSPGFEAIFAIAGLFVVAYLVHRKKK